MSIERTARNMTSSPNPYAVTTSEMSPPMREAGGPPTTRGFRALVIAVLSYLIMGTILACVDIETIVVSGPLLFAVGLFLFWITRGDRHPGFRFLPWNFILFPVLCFWLIYAFGLSPPQAQLPIGALIALFTLVIVVCTGIKLGNSRTLMPPHQHLAS
ncbi:MAG: hypothetical protein MI861_24795 [Pirellulales bacterium]|nr:hypothetical protein [Pirellulales bacterium]